MHISLGFPDPRNSSSLPVLQRVQLGIQSVQASKSSTKRTRLPITLEILDRLRVLWEKTQHTERILLWAVAALCFAGFFHAGELLPSSAASAPMSHCIRWGDVLVNKPSSPSVVKVHLRVSKCDQFGKGVDVFVGSLPNRRCPVTAVVAYMVTRGDGVGPFFITRSKSPLTKSKFVSEVRSALDVIGLDQTVFSGHSFRSGAATAAAQAGLSDSTIQTLGRWNSTAFLSYIRTPRNELASITKKFM